MQVRWEFSLLFYSQIQSVHLRTCVCYLLCRGHSSLDSPALQVVPEMDLRVDEDKEASFLVFLEGFAGKSAGP